MSYEIKLSRLLFVYAAVILFCRC